MNKKDISAEYRARVLKSAWSHAGASLTSLAQAMKEQLDTEWHDAGRKTITPRWHDDENENEYVKDVDALVRRVLKRHGDIAEDVIYAVIEEAFFQAALSIIRNGCVILPHIGSAIIYTNLLGKKYGVITLTEDLS